MSQLQLILLVLGIAVIAGVYFYTRRSGRRDYYDDVPTLEEVDEPDHSNAESRTGWADDPDLLEWPEGEDGRYPHGDPVIEDGQYSHDDPVIHDTEPEQPTVRADAVGSEEPMSHRWFKRFTQVLNRSAGEQDNTSPDASTAEGSGVRMPRAPGDDEKLIVLHVMARGERYLDGDQVHAALESCKLQFGPRHIYHRVKEVDGVPESVFSVANMFKPGYLDPAERDHLVTRGLSLFMVVPGPEEAIPAFRDMLGTAHNLAQALEAVVHDENRQPLTRQMAQFIQEEVVEVERRHRVANLQGR